MSVLMVLIVESVISSSCISYDPPFYPQNYTYNVPLNSVLGPIPSQGITLYDENGEQIQLDRVEIDGIFEFTRPLSALHPNTKYVVESNGWDSSIEFTTGSEADEEPPNKLVDPTAYSHIKEGEGCGNHPELDLFFKDEGIGDSIGHVRIAYIRDGKIIYLGYPTFRSPEYFVGFPRYQGEKEIEIRVIDGAWNMSNIQEVDVYPEGCGCNQSNINPHNSSHILLIAIAIFLCFGPRKFAKYRNFPKRS